MSRGSQAAGSGPVGTIGMARKWARRVDRAMHARHGTLHREPPSLLTAVILSNGSFQAVEWPHGAALGFFRARAFSSLAVPKLATPRGDHQPLGLPDLNVLKWRMYVGKLHKAGGWIAAGSLSIFQRCAACHER